VVHSLCALAFQSGTVTHENHGSVGWQTDVLGYLTSRHVPCCPAKLIDVCRLKELLNIAIVKAGHGWIRCEAGSLKHYFIRSLLEEVIVIDDARNDGLTGVDFTEQVGLLASCSVYIVKCLFQVTPT